MKLPPGVAAPGPAWVGLHQLKSFCSPQERRQIPSQHPPLPNLGLEKII